MDWEEAKRPKKTIWSVVESRIGVQARRMIGAITGRDPFMGDRRRYPFAHGMDRSSRIAIVKHLIHVNAYNAYLEIGVRRKESMHNNIQCQYKVSVDPDPETEADFCMTSDEFFATIDSLFDIVFIDGNHTGEQVERDIRNSLSQLNPGGVILLHDMNPPSAFHARRIYEVDGRFPSWNGTSWKGFAALRRTRSDLEMCVVETDWGVGIVKPGRQEPYNGPCDSYADLARARKRILRLITVPEFLRRFSTPISP